MQYWLWTIVVCNETVPFLKDPVKVDIYWKMWGGFTIYTIDLASMMCILQTAAGQFEMLK